MLEQDERVLRELARSCKDAKEKIRLLALHAISAGHSAELTAEIFCVDQATVYRWLEQWQQERSLKENEKSGRPPAFSQSEKDELRKLVEESTPQDKGLNASAWDCAELQKHFASLGKSVSCDTLRRYLKEMGAHYVKAILAYDEADVKMQAEFAREFLASLRGKNRAVAVFFQDEMSAETTARKGYGWTFEKRLIINAPQAAWEKVNAFGAVNPFTGEVVELASADAKAPSFIRLLRKLLVQHPRQRVLLCLDNSRVHHSRLLKSFLERHPRLQVKYLPAYSPELNPKEYWHAFVRKKLLNNRSFASARAVALALNRFARNTPKEVVRSVCTLQPLYALAK